MPRDFTLREVALSPAPAPGVFDLSFRGGRLARITPRETPADAVPRLYAALPFWDGHLHLLHVGLARQRLDFSTCASLAEALSALEAFAREHAEAAMLWAENFDESAWPERRVPTATEIDALVSDRPVVLKRVCGHLAVLNSRALEGAAARWGRLDPSGCLREEQAMGLSALWPPSPTERETALREAQREALGMGIARISEMGSQGAVDAYLGLLKRDELDLEVALHFQPSQFELAQRLEADGWLTRGPLMLGGIKIFTDGSIGARTAALAEPYAGSGERGSLLYEDDALAALLARCLDAGFPAVVHAIGDAAIEQVLSQMTRVTADRPRPPRGWAAIEHAELLTDAQLATAARLGVRLGLQPNFIARWGRPGGLYETALGQERWERMNPLRKIWDAGLALLFGSDGMPMDPALGLRGAVEHPVPAARLTPAEALAAYRGERAAGLLEWEPEPPWRLGSDRVALFAADPARWVSGDRGAARLLGLYARGGWVVAPEAELLRRGALHED
jgi:predicted amidohydrolase YtcJ